ncbi:hypothetical protein BUALT_Bualt19G0070200 [Buddleja alternifolia]|uniref:TRF2/HOY1 PH-like domain-containing protein n=1 Tax=Buddleja alternifolia TaxID=168488 RepID=A0AAV6W075_9LAMI|nr:hypothetical protein BUALT_Bualt19G0070200 [Buddleja alternifolia]
MGDINEKEQGFEDLFETANQSFDNNGGFQSFDEDDSGSPFVIQLEDVNTSPESAPIGLKLNKTPSFMNLLETMMSKEKQPEAISTLEPINHGSGSQSMSPKLKASNFPISSIRIGNWQRRTVYQGDLIAKLYYAKRKMVWEVLERPLKNKMEIQWSDIIAIRAIIHCNEPGYLEIELNQPPVFQREINPQPKKHTVWQHASDFTHGQATTWRRHYVSFPPGILDKHYERLLQCDERLLDISRKPFPSQEHACFTPPTPLSYGISQPSFNLNGYGFGYGYGSGSGSRGGVMPGLRLPGYPLSTLAAARGTPLQLTPNPTISGMHYSSRNNIGRNDQFMTQRMQKPVWNHQGTNTSIGSIRIQEPMPLTTQTQGNNQVFNPENYHSNERLRSNALENYQGINTYAGGIRIQEPLPLTSLTQGNHQGYDPQSYQSNGELFALDEYLLKDTHIDEAAGFPLQQVESMPSILATNVNNNPNNNPYDLSQMVYQMADTISNQVTMQNCATNSWPPPSSMAMESTVDNSIRPDLFDLLDLPPDNEDLISTQNHDQLINEGFV